MSELKKFSHFILTRFNTQVDVNGQFLYDKEEPNQWMEKRMPLFERTRDSVLSQDGDFKWVISLDKRTPNRYVQRIITDHRMLVVNCDVRDTFNEIEVETPWVITTRLDNDDLYLPGTVRAIQSRFEQKIKVIDLGFLKLDGDKVYHGKRRWPNSMFISLIEPADKIQTAFCRPHGQVYSGYPIEGHYSTGWTKTIKIPAETIEKKQAIMVCHGSNMTNKVAEDDNYLCTYKDLIEKW